MPCLLGAYSETHFKIYFEVIWNLDWIFHINKVLTHCSYIILDCLPNSVIIPGKTTKANLTPYVVEPMQLETSSVKIQNSHHYDSELFLCPLHFEVGLPRCQHSILSVGWGMPVGPNFCIPLTFAHCGWYSWTIFCGPDLGFLTTANRIFPSFDTACQPLIVCALF